MPTLKPWEVSFFVDIMEVEPPADSPTISVSKFNDDMKMLETGLFADCTVVCGDQKWATHKVILSRSPYFARVFSPGSGFKLTICILLKEAAESKITIENFEPFEVAWLLRYIYGLRIDVENARETSPSKSFLETCALLWSIGDFFLIQDLKHSVITQSQKRWNTLLLQTRCASKMLEDIDFLPNLEAGIRAAWRNDRAASPMRLDLVSLSVGIHPFVKDHDSFISLLDEMPEFTAQYLKALLGCPKMQRIEVHALKRLLCFMCRMPIYDSEGAQFTDEIFVWTPTSWNFGDNHTHQFCSKDCFQSFVSKHVDNPPRG